MEENLSKFITAIIAIFILFVFPVYIAYEKKDDISYALAVRYTQDFVDSVRSKGYVTDELYQDFYSSLLSTGNTYDIELEHEYVRYDREIAATGGTGYAIRNSELYGTEHILNVLSTGDRYVMNVNDGFNVKIRNTNVTFATILYNMVTINMSNNNTRIYVDYGGKILADKWYATDLNYSKYGGVTLGEAFKIEINASDIDGARLNGRVPNDIELGDEVQYVSNGVEWIYFGLDDNGNILLTSKEPVVSYEINGLAGFIVEPTKMDSYCNREYGSVYGIARNMKVEDVNKVLGYTPPSSFTKIGDLSSISSSVKQTLVGQKEVKDYEKIDYTYQIADYKNATDNEYKIINSSQPYWLSSPYTTVSSSSILFSMYAVKHGSVEGYEYIYSLPSGQNAGSTIKLRPVIVLNSDISIGGKNNDGDWVLDSDELDTKVPVEIWLKKTNLEFDVVKGTTATQRIEIDYTKSKGISPASVIKYTSSKPSIVTVDSNGYVTATGQQGGDAVIYVTYGDVTVTCLVEVTVREPKINLSDTVKTLEVGNGNTYQLSATTENINGSLTWSSSDDSVASVSSSGLVTVKKAGTVIITVTGGGISKTCTITVVELKLTPSTLTIEITTGSTSTAQLTVTKSSNIPSVEWSSSDDSVASVSATGLITAKAAGTTTITVTGGGISKTCTVTVKLVLPRAGDKVAYNDSSGQGIMWVYFKTSSGQIYLTSSRQTNNLVTYPGSTKVWKIPNKLNGECAVYNIVGWGTAHHMNYSEFQSAKNRGLINSSHTHWLAEANPSSQPTGSQNVAGDMGVVIDGTFNWIPMNSASGGGWRGSYALRPVVVLNSNVTFGPKNSSGEWTLVKK